MKTHKDTNPARPQKASVPTPDSPTDSRTSNRRRVNTGTANTRIPTPQTDEMARLQKVLAGAGVASRRQIEKMVEQGRIKINGQVVTEQGRLITSRDRVEIDGKKVEQRANPHIYIMLHKPIRVLSTVKDEHGRKNVRDLLPKEIGRVYPVGRLDYETSGLLLLTNDGDLTLKLTHPRYGVPKTYRIRLNKALNKEDLLTLRRGVPLEDGMTRPAKVVVSPVSNTTSSPEHWAEMTLSEGRNRQVRRMFEHFGYEVLALERTSYASLSMQNLAPGAYRKLTPREIAGLKQWTMDN
ncbi:MAG: rRNA pseudouridine synthase [Gracilibacteraceae bacterium]|nr:rRNA pseudouridine synthase [Gracilibacteraceae bacterium]